MKYSPSSMKKWSVLVCILGQMCATLCAMTPQIIPAPTPPVRAEMQCTECNEEGMVVSKLKRGDNRAINKTGRVIVSKDKTLFYVPCKVCKGERKYVRELTLAERVELYLKARERYEQAQLVARRKPVGNVYAAADALDALDPETFAALAAKHPVKCKKCYGFAKTPCKRCKSLGVTMKFTYTDDGELLQELCKSCDGEGAHFCKTCKGSGLARMCTRCKGRGLLEKPAKKELPATVQRCKSCLGMGRR